MRRRRHDHGGKGRGDRRTRFQAAAAPGQECGKASGVQRLAVQSGSRLVPETADSSRPRGFPAVGAEWAAARRGWRSPQTWHAERTRPRPCAQRPAAPGPRAGLLPWRLPSCPARREFPCAPSPWPPGFPGKARTDAARRRFARRQRRCCRCAGCSRGAFPPTRRIAAPPSGRPQSRRGRAPRRRGRACGTRRGDYAAAGGAGKVFLRGSPVRSAPAPLAGYRRPPRPARFHPPCLHPPPNPRNSPRCSRCS